MRKYQAIWQQLKLHSECKLIAHPSLHRRIKKAVSKEKHADLSYKIQWDMACSCGMPELIRLTDPTNPNILIFKLVLPITLKDL